MSDSFQIAFDRRHRILARLLSFLFIIAILFRLHGYSLSQWHEYIGDQSARSEVLIGKPRDIRSDDFDEALPFIFASERAAFPVSNPLIGSQGQNMLVTMHPVPVLHVLTFFRPLSWGYFLGPDVGMAWSWWVSYFGLFYSVFLLFMIVSRNNFWLSFAGSLAFLYSAFFQAWAFYFCPELVWMVFSLVSFHQLAFARGGKQVFGWSIGLFSAMGFFAFRMYPPTQIALSYAFVALAVGLFLRENALGAARFSRLKIVLPITLLAVAIVGVLFFRDAREAILSLIGSVYPGHRLVEIGGGRGFLSVFGGNFVPRFFLKGGDWTPFGNNCEGAGFFVFAPLVFMVGAFSLKQLKRDPLVVCMTVLFLFEFVWITMGMPAGLAQILLVNRIPPGRMLLSLGLCDFVLMVAYFSAEKRVSISRLQIWAILAIWIIGHLLLGWGWHWEFHQFLLSGIIFGALFSGAFGYLFLTRSRWFFWGLFAIAFVANGWINPLVRGGSHYLVSNVLSQKMFELDATSGHTSKWVVFNHFVLPDLPRILGIHSLNGMLYVPQLDFWKTLDPTGKDLNIYNRSAHVMFELTDQTHAVEFRKVSDNSFYVRVNPDQPLFDALKVDYLLIVGDRARFPAFSRYAWVFSVGNNHIFARK